MNFVNYYEWELVSGSLSGFSGSSLYPDPLIPPSECFIMLKGLWRLSPFARTVHSTVHSSMLRHDARKFTVVFCLGVVSLFNVSTNMHWKIQLKWYLRNDREMGNSIKNGVCTVPLKCDLKSTVMYSGWAEMAK